MPRELLCSFLFSFRMDDGAALDVLVEVVSLVQAWSGNPIEPSSIARISVQMKRAQERINIFFYMIRDCCSSSIKEIGSTARYSCQHNISVFIVTGLITMIPNFLLHCGARTLPLLPKPVKSRDVLSPFPLRAGIGTSTILLI